MQVVNIAKDQTVLGVGHQNFETATSQTNYRTIQASASTTSGNGTVVVVIEATNDDLAWLTVATITVNPQQGIVASDGVVISAPWRKLRARVTSISGTGTKVNVTVGA